MTTMTCLYSDEALDSLEEMKFAQILLLFGAWALSSCAYNLGYGERSLPGGYNRVSVPVFQNKSEQVGIEVFFTNALIREFEQSRVARVADSDEAPVSLEGQILNVEIARTGLIAGGQGSGVQNLPSDAVLSSEYRLIVYAHLRLRRKSDRQILWEGAFQKEGVYSAPRVGSAVLNSANANYNESIRDQRIQQIAEEMMEEAHDRITENF